MRRNSSVSSFETSPHLPKVAVGVLVAVVVLWVVTMFVTSRSSVIQAKSPVLTAKQATGGDAQNELGDAQHEQREGFLSSNWASQSTDPAESVTSSDEYVGYDEDEIPEVFRDLKSMLIYEMKPKKKEEQVSLLPDWLSRKEEQ